MKSIHLEPTAQRFTALKFFPLSIGLLVGIPAVASAQSACHSICQSTYDSDTMGACIRAGGSWQGGGCGGPVSFNAKLYSEATTIAHQRFAACTKSCSGNRGTISTPTTPPSPPRPRASPKPTVPPAPPAPAISKRTECNRFGCYDPALARWPHARIDFKPEFVVENQSDKIMTIQYAYEHQLSLVFSKLFEVPPRSGMTITVPTNRPLALSPARS